MAVTTSVSCCTTHLVEELHDVHIVRITAEVFLEYLVDGALNTK